MGEELSTTSQGSAASARLPVTRVVSTVELTELLASERAAAGVWEAAGVCAAAGARCLPDDLSQEIVLQAEDLLEFDELDAFCEEDVPTHEFLPMLRPWG